MVVVVVVVWIVVRVVGGGRASVFEVSLFEVAVVVAEWWGGK